MGILGRVAASLATAVVLTSASVGAVEAAPSATDPYSTRITTTTVIRTPTPIRTDTRITMTVKVTANSSTQPTGQLTVELHSAPGGAGQARTAAGPAGWTRTIDYDGGTERLVGPPFPKAGTWLVTAVFTPDDNQFRGSRDGWTFEVVDGPGDHNDPGDDNDDEGGLLPDTGGPAFWLLLLGLVLLGAGAAAVVVARRRRATVPASAEAPTPVE